MRLNNFLNTVCDNIKYAPVRETIKTELKEHIIEEKQNYIDNGMNDLEAEQKAISNMGSPDQISQSFNKIYRKKLDWKLLLIFIILTAINILLFVSISMKQNNDISYIVRNISYIFIGLVLSFFIYFFNYISLKKFSIGIGIIGLLISIINLYLYDTHNYEILNNLHINLNILSIFAYIIAFSSFINSINSIDNANKKNIIFTSILSVSSLVLLYLTNDTVLLYTLLAIYIILTATKLLHSSSKKIKIITLSLLCIILLYAIFTVTISQPHLLKRMYNNDIEISMMRERLEKSKLIGEANIPQDVNTDYYYLEFSNYSYIYIIEHYGKIVGLGIIIMLLLLSIKLIFNYKQIKDKFGKFLILGLGSFIFIQMIFNLFTILGIVNLGMVNLPFITHNNASIIVYMLTISLILSIYSRKDIIINSES